MMIMTRAELAEAAELAAGKPPRRTSARLIIPTWDEVAEAAITDPGRAPRLLTALDAEHTGVRLFDINGVTWRV